jgi:hypothetical protein
MLLNLRIEQAPSGSLRLIRVGTLVDDCTKQKVGLSTTKVVVTDRHKMCYSEDGTGKYFTEAISASKS